MCNDKPWGKLGNLFAVALYFYALLISTAWAGDSFDAVKHPRGGYTIYVVPHSHIDLEWLWNYEQIEATAIRILHQALEMLRQDSRFAFTQDQMLALKPFWDGLSDDDRLFLRRMVREGRFELTTGMLVQPDVNEPDFVSLSRQFLVAKPWMEQMFGAKILTAWNIDTFGQTVQMPQLYRGAGLKYFVFMRDVPPTVNNSIRNLFYWRSPDGSTVLAHQLSGAYSAGVKMRQEFHTGASAALPLRDLILHNPEGNDKIMLPWGEDLYLPTESSSEMEATVRQAAAVLGLTLKSVVIATPSRYFDDVGKGSAALPTYDYDFNPPLLAQDLRGLWAERPREKLAERHSEDVLEPAEKMASIASLYGMSYPSTELSWGWDRVLRNQNHDTMGGSHSDMVYHTAMSRYAGALEVGRQIEADALFQLSRKVDSSASGDFPLLVFNALSFPRSEVVHVERTFYQDMDLIGSRITNFRILDTEGHPVPFRVRKLARLPADYGQPRPADEAQAAPITMADIEFLAADVPSLGYRVYRIEPIAGVMQDARWKAAGSDIYTRYYEAHIDPASGNIVTLKDRRSGEELLPPGRHGGNELVLEEEKSADLEGTTHLSGSEIRSGQSRPTSITQLTDGLGTVVRIQGPFLSGDRIQEIHFYGHSPRIDFRTEVSDSSGHDGIVSVVFPIVRGADSRAAYETHNAVTMRPDGIYDAQTWVDVGNARKGMALFNRGTGGYQIERDEMRLLLLRSVNDYGFYIAPEASEAGRLVFEYSLFPHRGDWNSSEVVSQAHSFNSPLRTLPTDAHAGMMPAQYSFLDIDAGRFEVTSLKKAERDADLILRGHETSGQPGRVRLKLKFPVESASRTDLLENPTEPVDIHAGIIEFDCRPFEFVTLRLAVRP